MNPKDREVLDWMLENNNEPYIVEGDVYYHGECIFNSNYVISTIDYKENNKNSNSKTPAFLRVDSNKITKYKLKDDVYKTLKFLKEKYGKISKF